MKPLAFLVICCIFFMVVKTEYKVNFTKADEGSVWITQCKKIM